MGIDCASIMIPVRRSHGLCVYLYTSLNTKAMRTLQRGCRKAAASHGFWVCINPNVCNSSVCCSICICYKYGCSNHVRASRECGYFSWYLTLVALLCYSIHIWLFWLGHCLLVECPHPGDKASSSMHEVWVANNCWCTSSVLLTRWRAQPIAIISER